MSRTRCEAISPELRHLRCNRHSGHPGVHRDWYGFEWTAAALDVDATTPVASPSGDQEPETR
jgi:hypothetical protein